LYAGVRCVSFGDQTSTERGRLGATRKRWHVEAGIGMCACAFSSAVLPWSVRPTEHSSFLVSCSTATSVRTALLMDLRSGRCPGKLLGVRAYRIEHSQPGQTLRSVLLAQVLVTELTVSLGRLRRGGAVGNHLAERADLAHVAPSPSRCSLNCTSKRSQRMGYRKASASQVKTTRYQAISLSIVRWRISTGRSRSRSICEKSGRRCGMARCASRSDWHLQFS